MVSWKIYQGVHQSVIVTCLPEGVFTKTTLIKKHPHRTTLYYLTQQNFLLSTVAVLIIRPERKQNG